ncbi:MAG: M3 family metallopeptidase [bacterium]
MSNPLLSFARLPAFQHIRVAHIKPAVEQQLQHNRQLIDERLAQVAQGQLDLTWDNFIRPLEVADNQLEKLWSPVSHLNAVMNTPELRDAYNECLPLLSAYHTEIGQHKALYDTVVQLREQGQAEGQLNAAQQKSLDDDIRGFKQSGVDLSDEAKARYKTLSQRLTQLSAQYSDNVLDATQAWTLHISDEQELAGLPEFARAMAAQAARERDQEGWVFTLDFPAYYVLITYSDRRELREKIYRAYTTKASDQAENTQWDNQDVMREILQLREEKAALLGFNNYAALSLDSKMAESPETVLQFLRDLAVKSKPFAEQEFAELQSFAQQTLGLETLNAWDIAYCSEKLKQQNYGISDEDLKPYFPVDQVITGMFGLVERLYGIKIREVSNDHHEPLGEVQRWHPDVRFYQIEDDAGDLLAVFYFDLYARQHKRGGAWMSDYCSRFYDGKAQQIPVAYMTCNSTPPVDDKPALFTHDEVETLFHEFGHGLHHMLTQVDYLGISGINGVEWDAVELPSQFMENWCWERDALDLFAKHYETGETIPDDLFAKMQASKHFQAGMMMLRQIEFALFDMLIHRDSSAKEAGQIAAILQAVRDEVAVVQPPSYNRFENSFSHIFAGGYAAGYYSYKWAEVLSADAFARFEEEGLFNVEVGDAFRKEILAVGGSRPALDSFRAFRGRAPQVDALLRHNGLG